MFTNVTFSCKMWSNVISLLFIVGFVALPCQAATPVVIWHGMGDTCCNPSGMGKIKETIEQTTGGHVLSIKIGNSVIDDTINGFLKPINKQVEMVCQQLSEDPIFQNGFHAVGFSQGSQFLRAVAQRCPNPPMKSLVTMGGQHQGVYGFPKCPGESIALCNIMRELLNLGAYIDMVQSTLVQAQYWHDPLHFDTYVEKSQFIAEINNEGPVKNESYAENLANLENFVLVKFNQDTMVEPRESQHFEFYAPGSSEEVVPLRQSPIYTEDRIGLKALDEAGKLHFISIDGDHLDFSLQWFVDNIVKVYLN